MWAPEKLELQRILVESNPDADICVSGRRFLRQNAASGKYELAAPLSILRESDIPSALYGRCPFTTSCVMVRRSAFLDAGVFDPAIRLGEDWDLWIRLLERGSRFLSCTEPVTYYRFRSGSLTQDVHHVLQAEMELYDRRIGPRLPQPKRFFSRWKRVSALEGDLAIMKREQGVSGYLSTMILSILLCPFGGWRRYKVAAHMSLHRLGIV